MTYTHPQVYPQWGAPNTKCCGDVGCIQNLYLSESTTRDASDALFFLPYTLNGAIHSFPDCSQLYTRVHSLRQRCGEVGCISIL